MRAEGRMRAASRELATSALIDQRIVGLALAAHREEI
jgi:hypothetical protein